MKPQGPSQEGPAPKQIRQTGEWAPHTSHPAEHMSLGAPQSPEQTLLYCLRERTHSQAKITVHRPWASQGRYYLWSLFVVCVIGRGRPWNQTSWNSNSTLIACGSEGKGLYPWTSVPSHVRGDGIVVKIQHNSTGTSTWHEGVAQTSCSVNANGRQL